MMAWVLVYTTNSETDARLVEGLLHAEDIPAQMVSQVDSMRGFSVGALAIAKVYVPAEFVPRADAIVQALNSTNDGNADLSL